MEQNTGHGPTIMQWTNACMHAKNASRFCKQYRQEAYSPLLISNLSRLTSRGWGGVVSTKQTCAILPKGQALF